MEPYFQSDQATVYWGSALEYLKKIPDNSVHLCLTSSDYWKQVDHGISGQLGLAQDPWTFISNLADVFDQVHRVLVPGGCLFQVMADTQNNKSPIREAGSKRRDRQYGARRRLVEGYREKEPLDIPYELSLELRERGWLKRATYIWDKMSGGDPTQSDSAPTDHEWILYFFKYDSPGRPYSLCKGFKSSIFRYKPVRDPEGVHACPFPSGLAAEIIERASNPGETVLDPFGGMGTTAATAVWMDRKAITGDISQRYCDRIVQELGYSTDSGTRQFTIMDVLMG